MSKASDVLDDLKAVFGEATSWSGFALPNIHQMKIQPSTGPASMRAPKGAGWGETAAFPFHTASAEKVWKEAKKLIFKHKTAGTNEIVRMAIDASGVLGVELTPEDAKLLSMAVDWARNGPPSPVSQLRSP